MTMTDGPHPFRIFRDLPTAANDVQTVPSDNATTEYFRRRERAERAAAKLAVSPAARRAHQKLAQLCANLAGEPAAK